MFIRSMRLTCIALFLNAFAGHSTAEDTQDTETKAGLIAAMVAGGQHEYEDERHAVEVNDCQLTTYRWMRLEDEGWVLWTSFEFPMLLVDLSENSRADEIEYFFGTKGDPEMAFIVFTGKDGYEFTHEKPFHRKSTLPHVKSPRGDGTTHFIERKSQGAIVQQGPGVIDKARLFTNAYIRYRQEFCMFIG